MAKLVCSSTDGRSQSSFFNYSVCICDAIKSSTLKLFNGVGLFSVKNGHALKGVLGCVVIDRDMLYAPTVAGEKLIKGQVNDLLVFLEVDVSVIVLINTVLVTCVGVKMLFQVAICIFYNMVAGFRITIDKEEVAGFCPSVAGLDFVKACNLSQTAELVIVGVRSKRVGYKLAIVVVVPITEVYGTTGCFEFIGLGNGIAVFIGFLEDLVDLVLGDRVVVGGGGGGAGWWWW